MMILTPGSAYIVKSKCDLYIFSIIIKSFRCIEGHNKRIEAISKVPGPEVVNIQESVERIAVEREHAKQRKKAANQFIIKSKL